MCFKITSKITDCYDIHKLYASHFNKILEINVFDTIFFSQPFKHFFGIYENTNWINFFLKKKIRKQSEVLSRVYKTHGWARLIKTFPSQSHLNLGEGWLPLCRQWSLPTHEKASHKLWMFRAVQMSSRLTRKFS